MSIAPKLSPVIFSLEGLSVSADEKKLFKDVQPAGFILFARNVSDPAQVKDLTASLRDCVSHDPLILIDQEGGRVQRMGKPHWRQYMPMNSFAPLFEQDPGAASRLLRLHCRMIASDLHSVGINVNCLPLLDMPVDGADDIIGDRALATNSALVAALGRIVMDSLMETGVLPVVKHIPGHGRATVDSHKDLPIVTNSLQELRETDFDPFTNLSDAPLAMTAHITYADIDPDYPATLSSIVIGRVIRMLIGFKGLLMSDDIGMHALKGTMQERTTQSLKAGCDLVLHCSGDLSEMQVVASVLPQDHSPELASRLKNCLKMISRVNAFDREALEDEYDRLMAQLCV